MVWLHDGEKCLFVLTEYMNVTDGWTHRHCLMA